MERAEVTVYDNQQLRNQWESRANANVEKDKLERQRVEKSALNGLFQEWNYRLALRSGIPTSGEKKAKGTDMSDFRKYVVTAPVIEQDEKELQAKFKALNAPRKPPPPPRQKSPPPQKKREPRPAPAARKERPKPEEKKPSRAPEPKPKPQPARAKSGPQQMSAPASRAVYKDNLSQAGWNESWKALKPFIDMEGALGSGRDASDFDVHKYRYGQPTLEETQPASSEWSKSWASMKNDMHKDYPMEQKPGKSFHQSENVNSSEWTESWKMQNLELHQEADIWGGEWPQYSRQTKAHGSAEEQYRGDMPQGWDESWKSFKCEPNPEKEHAEFEEYWDKEFADLHMHGVFCPGWSDSWKVPEKQHHFKPGKEVYLNDWCESWKCSKQRSWCEESSYQRYRHHNLMMSKRMFYNNRRTKHLQDELSDMWSESWRSPKSEAVEEESMSEYDVSHVPLNFQFHLLNTPFSGWEDSWCISKAHKASGRETKPRPHWRNSWKYANQNPTASQEDIVCWSDEHKASRLSESERECTREHVSLSEWSGSWESMKSPAKPDDTESQQELEEPQNGFPYHAYVAKAPLLDWNDSWRFWRNKNVKAYTVSLSRWTESWRSARCKHADEGKSKSKGQRRMGWRWHQEDHLKEAVQASDWVEAWQHLKRDSLKPDMPLEDCGEWGACWRALNPQAIQKKEAWSEQEFSRESEELRLHEPVMQKERKVLCPDRNMSEWSASWKIWREDVKH